MLNPRLLILLIAALPAWADDNGAAYDGPLYRNGGYFGEALSDECKPIHASAATRHVESSPPAGEVQAMPAESLPASHPTSSVTPPRLP